jgi:Plavaka transposase
MSQTRRTIPCDICGQSFLSQGGLTQHHRRKHRVGDRRRSQNIYFVTELGSSGDEDCGGDYEADGAREGTEWEDRTQPEVFPGAGASLEVQRIIPAYDDPEWKLLAPFENREQWTFCRTYSEENIGKNTLNRMISRDTINPSANIKSADHVRELIHKMEDGLDCEWEKGIIDIEGSHADFWYRDPTAIIRYIFRHPQFSEDLMYAPKKDYNDSGERVYNEMWTANWWWRQQVNSNSDSDSDSDSEIHANICAANRSMHLQERPSSQ